MWRTPQKSEILGWKLRAFPAQEIRSFVSWSLFFMKVSAFFLSRLAVFHTITCIIRQLQVCLSAFRMYGLAEIKENFKVVTSNNTSEGEDPLPKHTFRKSAPSKILARTSHLKRAKIMSAASNCKFWPHFSIRACGLHSASAWKSQMFSFHSTPSDSFAFPLWASFVLAENKPSKLRLSYDGRSSRTDKSTFQRWIFEIERSKER